MKWPWADAEPVKPANFASINFVDNDGNSWKYEPLETITPYEVALFLPLFSSLLFMNRFPYIEKHGLLKHLKKVEK